MSEPDAQLPTSDATSDQAASLPASKPDSPASLSPQQDSSAPLSPQPKRSGLDLSDLKIMPAWVSDFGKEPAARHREYDDADRPAFRDDRRRGDPGRDRGRGPAPRGDRPPFRRSEGAGPDRSGSGPRPPRGEAGFRGRDRDRRSGDGPPQREWVEIPRDVIASVHPEDKSLDALSAHIRSTGHAFSLFDIARLVLAGGDRFGVRFLCDEKRAQPLYRVPADGSLFLSQEEALQHVLRGPALESFYRVEEIEIEEPKGNFPSVALCGFSGEILGPASHHSFQTALIRLHRERFAHMSLEDYKRRVRTDTSPDLIQKWKDQQRKSKRWIPLSSDTEAPPPEPAADPAPAAEPAEGAESQDTPDSEAPPPPAAAPANALHSRQEMELHFKRHHGSQAVVETRDFTVHGNIDKRNLSPALFILLRQAVESARKHLFEMSQKLSAGFDRRGLKTFKRRSGKMFVCRVRPKAIDPSTVFAERVTAIVEHLKKAPGGLQLAHLLATLAPPPVAAKPVTPEPAVSSEPDNLESPGAQASPEAAETAPAPDSPVETPSPSSPAAPPAASPLSEDQLSILKDLRWLANEGYIIEYSDGLVCLGVQGETPSPKPAATAPHAPDAAPSSEVAPSAETAPPEETADSPPPPLANSEPESSMDSPEPEPAPLELSEAQLPDPSTPAASVAGVPEDSNPELVSEPSPEPLSEPSPETPGGTSSSSNPPGSAA